jgi:hypothetical protein
MDLAKKLGRFGALAALAGICLFIALFLRYALIGFIDPTPAHRGDLKYVVLNWSGGVLAAGALLMWAIAAGLWIAAVLVAISRRPR